MRPFCISLTLVVSLSSSARVSPFSPSLIFVRSSVCACVCVCVCVTLTRTYLRADSQATLKLEKRVVHYQAVQHVRSPPEQTAMERESLERVTIGEYEVQEGARGTFIRRRGLTSAYDERSKPDNGSW